MLEKCVYDLCLKREKNGQNIRMTDFQTLNISMGLKISWFMQSLSKHFHIEVSGLTNLINTL